MLQDKDILQILADNQPLLDAVRRVFEKQFDTRYELSDSNESLGERLRARLIGLGAIETALREIEMCGAKKEKLAIANPAR